MSTKLAQLRQFVTRVVSFTSEYSNTNWTSANLIGEPNSGNIYGDSTRAWCPSVDNENQVLELEFEWPVYIEKVNVYENLRGGSVTKIEAHNSINNEYVTVWSCESASLIEHYNIFSPSFDCIQFMSNRIRLTLTLENRSGFPEIEAVELIGFSIQFHIPDQTITSDISRLLFEQIFPDFSVEVSESEIKTHVFKLHRCILKLRCETMFDYFSQVDFKVNNLSIADMKLLIEFVYSDQLNENLLNEIINNEKLMSSVEDNTVDQIDEVDQDEDENTCRFDYKKEEEKWMLTLNRLIRYSIFFKQERLTQLLIRYLVTKFLNAENILNILLDSINYSSISSANNMEITDIEICNLEEIGKLKLENIYEICLAFCRHQIKSMVKMRKFRQLPKKILIEIICGL